MGAMSVNVSDKCNSVLLWKAPLCGGEHRRALIPSRMCTRPKVFRGQSQGSVGQSCAEQAAG